MNTLSSNSLLYQKKLDENITLFRKVITTSLIVISILALITSIFITPSAKVKYDPDDDGGSYYISSNSTTVKTKEVPKILGGTVLHMAYEAYCGFDNFGFLTIDFEDAGIKDVVDTAYNNLAAVGAGLALLWCLLELLEKASGGHITGEFILQLGIKLTIAVVIICEGPAIAAGCVELGNGIVKEVQGSASNTSSTDQMFLEVYNNLKGGTVFATLGELVDILLPYLTIKIAKLIIYALLAGRYIEVAVRYVFFPIGASDVFTHGMASPGFRYMKHLVGAVMQGAGMYIVLLVGLALMNNKDAIMGSSSGGAVTNAIGTAILPIIISFSMIGAMLKVSSIINDIVG